MTPGHEVSVPHAPVDLTPPSASHVPWNPSIDDGRDSEPPVEETAREEDQDSSAERMIEVPVADPTSAPTPDAASDDAAVTYLTVHSHLTQETLPQFGRSLEGLPGVRGTAVARVGDDAVELVVAHQRDIDLLAQMRSLPGMDFKLVARGEGLVEIELLERNAPPLRA